MKLVSSQSEQELRAAAAKERFDYYLRGLAANMMRVARGAGRPAEIPDQIMRCAAALQAIQEAAGRTRGDDIKAMLQLPSRGPASEEFADVQSAEGMENVLLGALQVAASSLLDQTIQAEAGRKQVLEGVRALHRARLARQLAQGDEGARQAAKVERAAVKSAMQFAEQAAHDAFLGRLQQQLTMPDGKPAKGSKARLALYKAQRGID